MLLSFFLIISAMHIPVIFYLGKESILIVVDEIRNKSISNEHLRKFEVRIFIKLSKYRNQ